MIVLYLQLRHHAGHHLWHGHMRAMRSESCDTYLFLPYENPFHDVSILRLAGGWLFCPPTSAVALVAILSLVSGVQGVFAVKQALNWSRLARFVLLALLGLPFGLAMLAHLNANMLKSLVGVMLALFDGACLTMSRGWRRWLPCLCLLSVRSWAFLFFQAV